MKNMKITAFAKLGSDDSKEPINRFISGNALIDLNGRRTLSVLKDFIPPAAESD